LIEACSGESLPRTWADSGSRQENAAQNNAFEPPGSGPRPSAGAKTRRQTLGQTCMKSVRPDHSDPIPLRRPPHHIGTIMIRFVGLLLAAVLALALIWSR